jgi:DNA-directed RNA polymerase
VLLREEFVELYGDNPLERFRREVMERTGLTLPEIPERGTLDIRQVMDAPYFFA